MIEILFLAAVKILLASSILLISVCICGLAIGLIGNYLNQVDENEVYEISKSFRPKVTVEVKTGTPKSSPGKGQKTSDAGKILRNRYRNIRLNNVRKHRQSFKTPKPK